MRLATAAQHMWLQAGSWHGHVFGEIITLVVRAGCAHKLPRITARSLHTYTQIGAREGCGLAATDGYKPVQIGGYRQPQGTYVKVLNQCATTAPKRGE